MSIDMIPWLISRATGITAFAALTAAMIAGLLVRTRTPVGGVKGAGMVEFHRLFSVTALIAMAVHGSALLLDPTVSLGPAQLLVPGLIEYRTGWTSLGVVAAELALVIHLSFRFRGRIGVKTWRRMHMLTYAVFALGLAHGVAAGTDTSQTWARVLYAGSASAVIALTWWRVGMARRSAAARSRRAPSPQASS